MNHVVPRVLNKPNKTQLYSSDFCRPCDCSLHPSLSLHCILDIPEKVGEIRSGTMRHTMVALTYGTFSTFVLAAIQLDVSESSSHFFIHFFKISHFTGSCQFSPQEKQNTCPHLQLTGRHSLYCTFMTLLQSGEGHHRKSLLHWTKKKKEKDDLNSIFHRNGSSSRTFIFTSTKLLVIRCWYLRRTFESLTSLMTVTSSTRISQPCAAQAIVWPTPSSIILVVR